MDYFMQKGTK